MQLLGGLKNRHMHQLHTAELHQILTDFVTYFTA